jgi:UDP-N-acetylmuramoyl-tripeptide--D-alanyl-D-alanine ligase
MSALWTAAQAKAATGGSGADGWAASGVSIDSRRVAAGDLFVALRGPNHDGHDHVDAALSAGAAAAMVSHTPVGASASAPLLRVPDTQAGLEALAIAGRERFDGRVIALTGSVGKTGTKEMLRLLLAAQGVTSASEGNLNNHIGAPLSLARLPPAAQFGVFELGMNHPGEIRPLSRMVRPHCALITRIAPAHTAFFSSLDEVAAAKAEIFEGLEPGGVAIVNADDGYGALLSDAAQRASAGQVMRFGEAPGADARLISLEGRPDGSDVEAEVLGERFRYRIGAPGRHWAMNSLAALLAVASVGADVAKAAAAMVSVRPPVGRGAMERLRLPQGLITLIDESYNASPAAMRAAFGVLAGHSPAAGGRRVAILGDMLELGDNAEREHRELGAELAGLLVDAVFAVGPAMQALVAQLRRSQVAGYAGEASALASVVVPALRDGDVVLIKGSLGIGMAQIVKVIKGSALPEESGSRSGISHAL